MKTTTAAQRGLTLIEVMVALAVFAVLGMLTWKATSQLADARQHVGAEFERWRAISSAAHRIGNELQQIVPAAGALRLDTDGTSGSTSGMTGVLDFTMPAGQDGLPARARFLLIGRRLEWWLWDGSNPTAAPERLTLLDEVDAVRWRFLHEGRWYDNWPLQDEAAAPLLPAAVTLELDLPDAGTLQRTYALR
ncbi:type II secretion system protein GspJ [Thauera sp. Sel9]|uniref:type II secretion system protein GspJ n=1 Tax=Thauera sp. Sel9 TaxID=2974299 RepID=UPI0021E1820E|nr:type II secretion system protein GspJ [Thauera sp. Sel9]MCV2217865.1 prepilin-type N-terminal cleavage/methylation domain-containing protein [Thauera sp. Sel9]